MTKLYEKIHNMQKVNSIISQMYLCKSWALYFRFIMLASLIKSSLKCPSKISCLFKKLDEVGCSVPPVGSCRCKLMCLIIRINNIGMGSHHHRI